LYLCRVKRKQALVATNLSGIPRPTEMNRGPSKALCLTIILGVVSLKKTQAKMPQLSDHIGAITPHLSVSSSLRLPLSPSLRLPISPSLRLSVSLSLRLPLPLSPSPYLFVSLSLR